ncbi:MAG: DUF4982 domain-containing protein [Bacteroidaceae bacterium]|nr:DUF4982 domain-containing protein [Bacteroidaceae bacterium]
MRKRLSFLLCLWAVIVALGLLRATAAPSVTPLPTGRKTCIDRGWHFLLGDGSQALTQPSTAQAWRTLNLPHDWSVEPEAARQAGGTVVGPFSTNSVGGYQTGFTVGGEGWYYKRLDIPRQPIGKGGKAAQADRYWLYFEGVYNQAEVFLNGKRLYFNPYGYISFRVDVSGEIHEGENTLLVRVRNEGNNSRWYAGSGIYRHVWLLRLPALYADEWDTYMESQLRQSQADVNLHTTLYNEARQPKTCSVSVQLVDAQGRTVGTRKQKTTVGAGGKQPLAFSWQLRGIRPWSPESPHLYTAVIRVKDVRTGITDTLTKRFGIRSIDCSAQRGMCLNGQPVLLRGGCVHHDNGLLGACAYDRAEERKLELLKVQGFNAVRTSHGLPSEHFLDVCDSLGLMVVDETFDQWLLKKNDEDYHRYFPQHSTQDLQTMVRRDRNHPSIVMWSIGNEIPGRIEPDGMEVAECLRRTILELDTSRPVTAAICGWDAGDNWNAAAHNWEVQDAKAFESLDVGGYNYLYDKYEHDHATHPQRVMCGLESYPKQASENWTLVERLPYVIGDFVWTAMDYLGEAGIGSAAVRREGSQSMFQGWPWYNGWCGDIDLIGQKKPQSYYRDVVWHRSPITMAVERPLPAGAHQSVSAWGWQLEEQNWTYPDLARESLMSVNVYSRAPQVRLYLNGQPMGDRVPGSTFWAGYQIPYRPGTLRAVNLDGNGNEVSGEVFELQTTGEPVALRLTPDRTVIRAGGADLAYLTIELIDREGRVVTSDSERRVNISVTEGGHLLASGNAAPSDMESFRSPQPRLFRGRALAIVNGGDGRETSIRIEVTSEGLPAATAVVALQ